MTEQNGITGEWIKQQCEFAYEQYKQENKTDIFVYNPKAAKLYQRIAQLQSKCPHSYENGQCIYCKKTLTEAM